MPRARYRRVGEPLLWRTQIRGRIDAYRHSQPSEEITVPIATPEVYADMLDRAKAGSFAYPAINITSSQTVTAAIRGFAEAGSDGIIQVSTGGAEYASGSTIKDMVTGSLALAAYAREVAKNYSVNIALHTDHCPKNKLDGFVRPLIAASAEQVKSTGLPIFQSHMWDGSAVPLDENLKIAEELLALAKAANIILEVEIGVVGGEEDGVANEINDQLYTTIADGLATAEALGLGEKGRYLTALTFGNVHGSTSRATSSCARRSSRRSRTRWASSTARTRRSTWSSTVARAPRRPRSPRPSTTASSR